MNHKQIHIQWDVSRYPSKNVMFRRNMQFRDAQGKV